MAGHSTAAGFRLMGEIPTEAVQSAVEEALRRLQAGESKLAVHPNCGTNFVTAGTLSGLAAAFLVCCRRITVAALWTATPAREPPTIAAPIWLAVNSTPMPGTVSPGSRR